MGFKDLFKKKDEFKTDFSSTSGLDSNLGGDMNSMKMDFGNDSLGLDNGMNSSIGASHNTPSSFGQNQGPSTFGAFGQQPSSASPPGDMQKDIQMLSLKMDAIKSELDTISQRLKNLESIAEKGTVKRWY